MNKKWIAAALCAGALTGLWGCNSEPATTAYVQNVGEITGAGSIRRTSPKSSGMLTEPFPCSTSLRGRT